jgi:hypothetical protein
MTTDQQSAAQSSHTSIYRPTPLERALAAHIRSLCLVAIRQLKADEQRAKLGCNGFQLNRHLYGKPEWSLERAFRTAECLDLPIVDKIMSAAQVPSGDSHASD